MIECVNVHKKYGSHMALNDLSFTLHHGVYGLIGENGAGKSTLFKTLIGEENCSSGKILIDGTEPSEGKLKIGYLPQKFDFFQNISVYDSMEYIGLLKGLEKKEIKEQVSYWLKQVNLWTEKKKKVSALSGGMKQRLGIAQAFLGNPEYILLDEPTVGLDPKERLVFRNLVNEIGANKMILISTHIIDDVQAACENILVLHNGNLLYSGTTQGFIDGVSRPVYTIRIPRAKLAKWNTILNIISIKLFGEELEVRYYENEQELPLLDAKRVDCTLEDAYFFATGMFFRKEDFNELLH